MRAVVQRVTRAAVRVNGHEVAAIAKGMVVLVGVAPDDTADTARALAAKVAGLRIFEDTHGRMDLGLADVGGGVLAVSQFTLYGDVRRGRRPSFDGAAPAAQAAYIYEAFCLAIEAAGLPCGRGVFGAEMAVELVNDGPVTLIIDTETLTAPRRG